MSYHLGTMTRRILAVYDRAKPEDMILGAHWYDTASKFAQSLADTYGQPLPTCAAVIAALSPRQSWAVNRRFADAMVAEFASGASVPSQNYGLGNSTQTAWSILQGTGELGGLKVRSFYENILGDTFAVTVDTWSGYIAMGKRAQTFTPKQYETIAQAYRNAAKLRGIHPRDMQAITWCVIRGKHD